MLYLFSEKTKREKFINYSVENNFSVNYYQAPLGHNFNVNSNLLNQSSFPQMNDFYNNSFFMNNNFVLPQSQLNNSYNLSALYNSNGLSSDNNYNDMFGIQNYNKQIQEIRDSILKFY